MIGVHSPHPPYHDAAFHPVRLPRWAPLGVNAAYAAGVRQAVQAVQAALVEVHNQPELAYHLALRLRPRSRVALVLHNDPQGMHGVRTPSGRSVLLEPLAAVATVSQFLRRRFLEGLSERAAAKVSVLPNGIDLGAVPAPPAAAGREPLMLFAGRIVADKGADTFIAAAGRALPVLAGWRAEMIGADRFGPASPETRFLRALRPAAERAGVAMLGYRPHAEVMAAMARAAIVAVPSRWAEPFGLAALEAMASGAALICTSQGALPELAGDAALYVAPDDPAELAEAMVTLATEPARREALARAGLERAQRFDLARTAEAVARWRDAILA